MKKTIAAVMLSCLGLMSACNNVSSNESDGRLKVTATTGQIADLAKNIGGSEVEVEALMGPGIDPHLYQASQGDMKKLNEADIIFYNGLHLEGKMGNLLEKLSSEKPVHAVSKEISEDDLLADEENPSIHDPHIWFSIPLWMEAAEAVEKELSDLRPEQSETFQANLEDYKRKLQEMDAYAKEQIEQIPESGRVLVTAHDAFQYFGHQYGIEVMGLQGLSTESEYGLRDVQSLVDLLAERNIKSVFIETSISDKSITAVIEGAKQKGHTVTIGGELYSDAMGEEGTEAGTYLGMFKHNVDRITASLK
ncbi:manganese transporter [Bacillus lacus]|uniref:Manganese transporter n=1 Tax=Metabacillus lacus TaxID=1983721 RepID=A0A7X2LXC9_9BACI|nr:manganese transporter [Metabacillus lacus]